MPWDPFSMEKLLKNEICGSREQCTGSTSVTHSCEIFVGQRGCGSRALDPLTVSCPTWNAGLNKIKKGKCKHSMEKCNPNAY